MTIPGFTPYTAITMQNHIHLGVWGQGGLLGHNEPPYRFGHITKRTPIYEATATIDRAWNGTPSAKVMKTSGAPVVYTHYQYIVRTDESGLYLLANLFKREVMLVDTYHCSDSQDHTAYRKRYFFDTFNHEEMMDPTGALHVATCTFVDFNRIAPV